MGILILKDGKGELRRTWYGRIIYKGKANVKNLNVEIRGVVPKDENGNVKLSATGDEAFERTRKAALRELEAWRKATRTDPAELQEKAYKAQTGGSIEGIPLSKLFTKWEAIKRERPVTQERARNAHATFQRFADFAREYAKKSGKRCDNLGYVTDDMVSAWFYEIKAEYSWGTVTDMMHLMSGAFRRWVLGGDGRANNKLDRHNPFGDIILRGSKEQGEEKRRTERKALTPEQFARLMEFSRKDERLHPLIVCAAFTGMRIGDVCRMKVADVDLKSGTIDVVTQKSGVRVNIPIVAPELREVLAEHCAIPADGKKPSEYVFPWAAAQYEKNRTAIIRGVKPYFAKAVFGDEPQAEEVREIEADGERATVEIATAARDAGWSETKTARVAEVYNRFKAGEKSTAIAAEMRIARGQVSAYLKEAERLTGETLRPRAKRGKAGFVDLIERTRVERTVGKYAASVLGWHNLRHTFITYALNAGVPIIKVAAIVGHSTAGMTEKYADLTTKTAAPAAPVTPAAPAVVPSAPSVDALIADMTEAERRALARKLLDF